MSLYSPVRIVERRGDLFRDSSVSAFAHCVSRDLAMGRGIALEFKRRYGCLMELQCQMRDVGEVAVLNLREEHAIRAMSQSEAVEGMSYIPQFTYNLITKANYYDKPTMESLKKALEGMREHMIVHGVWKVAMPRLGCGLDGLKWPRVKELIVQVFSAPDDRMVIRDEDTGVLMRPSITLNVWVL